MELEFKPDDFSKLLFPITGMAHNVDPVKAFPRLLKYEEFKNTKISVIRKNKLFRYIVLLYDRNSPFNTKIDDLYKRKIEVAKYVKLIENPRKVDEEIKMILRNEDSLVNKMLIAYCRMQNSPLWSLVVALNEKFYNEFGGLMGKEDTGRKSISATMQELQKATSDLLNQDNTPQLLKDLFEIIEEERVSDLRPEGIAEIFSQGGKPFEDEDIDYNGAY